MLTDPFGTNALTRRIIGCAVRVHRAIGPGVYENVYSECMDYELRDEGLDVELGRAVPIIYRGAQLKSRYYVDMIVNGTVVVELKALVTLAEIHSRQVLTLVKLTRLPVGLLINFNVAKLADGVRRIVNPDYSRYRSVAEGRPSAVPARSAASATSVLLIARSSSFVLAGFVASFWRFDISAPSTVRFDIFVSSRECYPSTFHVQT